MNICKGKEEKEKEKKKTKFIQGHLYKWVFDDHPRVCVSVPNHWGLGKDILALFTLTRGEWVYTCGGDYDFAYHDVTDEYCLKKVES